MKSVKVDLPKETEDIEIILFADEHIGDPGCDFEGLKERIEYVKNNKNVYCVLGGDLMDNATKTSIGDTYSQTDNPMTQLELVEELLWPIRKKILGAVSGNHENRTYRKEGIDPTRVICNKLGILDRYDPCGLVMFIKFSNDVAKYDKHKVSYSAYLTHGSGGGRKEGAKAIRLADMASIVDVDVYIHCHSHLPMVMKEDFYRTDVQHNSVISVTKLFVNSAASLNYGGYGQANEYKPASKDRPVIWLNGSVKESKATL